MADGKEGLELPRVAVLMTAFYYRSHAHCFLENLLQPCLFNGEWHNPSVRVVSFYVDQFPPNDMSRAVAKRFGISLYPTIEGALRQGGAEIDVDAVLLIAEHGDYPTNELLQPLFPRKEFFDACANVFRRDGRVVPIFIDKHFSHSFDMAREMYSMASQLRIPLMAGSSVPLAERIPRIELPENARIAEIVAIHGGPLESYDFHALEIAQSLAEFRHGGETGVQHVQFLQGEGLWRAAEEGLWSPALAKSAMEAEIGSEGRSPRDLFENLAKRERWDLDEMHGILVSHRDGLRTTTLKIGSGDLGEQYAPTRHDRWNIALELDGKETPLGFRFHTGPWQNRCLFKALCHAIQAFFLGGMAPYPVERTLLTTGVLDAAMHSRLQGLPVDTPALGIAYKGRGFSQFREMGASWTILTDKSPEPHDVSLPRGILTDG